jgi:hypothetical protein
VAVLERTLAVKARFVKQGIVPVISTIAVLLALGTFIYNRLDTGIAASVEHKSAKKSKATIVTVLPIKGSDSDHNVSGSENLYQVCFDLDAFDQVESDIRRGYEQTETDRRIREGPRCKLTSKKSLVRPVDIGDRLDVVYLLENNYQIDVVSISFRGQVL